MNIKSIREKIQTALSDKQINLEEASRIRSQALELKPEEINSLKTDLDVKELTQDAKSVIDDLFKKTENAFLFSPSEIKLMDSIAFRRVLPNFRSLNSFEQRQVLDSLKPNLAKFPNFFEKLASVPNDNYGKGFNYFFSPLNGHNEEIGKIINNASEYAVGVVMPGASVIKSPVLNTLVRPFSEIKKFEIGGMYNIDIHHLMTHEMAHVVHLHFLNDDQRDEIGKLYDNAKNNKSFVTSYAETNPYEYFSDSVAAYFSTFNEDKKKLEEVDPKMYGFIKNMYESKPQYGEDGNLFTDPENSSYTYVHKNGKHLHGLSLNRESSLVTLENFTGGTTSEVSVFAGDKSGYLQLSGGIKASYKPLNEPLSFYGTIGTSVNTGIADGKVTAGIGAYAGAGVEYEKFNIEARHNFTTNGSSTEVRLGYKFDF